MARNIVYFDLETQRTANDAGGWSRKQDMGMSVGVTYSTASGEYRVYPEKRVNELIDQLMRAAGRGAVGILGGGEAAIREGEPAEHVGDDALRPGIRGHHGLIWDAAALIHQNEN